MNLLPVLPDSPLPPKKGELHFQMIRQFHHQSPAARVMYVQKANASRKEETRTNNDEAEHINPPPDSDTYMGTTNQQKRADAHSAAYGTHLFPTTGKKGGRSSSSSRRRRHATNNPLPLVVLPGLRLFDAAWMHGIYILLPPPKAFDILGSNSHARNEEEEELSGGRGGMMM